MTGFRRQQFDTRLPAIYRIAQADDMLRNNTAPNQVGAHPGEIFASGSFRQAGHIFCGGFRQPVMQQSVIRYHRRFQGHIDALADKLPEALAAFVAQSDPQRFVARTQHQIQVMEMIGISCHRS